jgi:hypothetical protein
MMAKLFYMLFSLAILPFTWASCSSKAGETGKVKPVNTALRENELITMHRRMHQHALSAATFAKTHGYNTRFCFLVDMSLPSGSNRFFVYDLEKDTVESAGVVAHGRCNENWLEGRKYSNENGSGCTSLGKYKIGKPYTGRFGLAYKLYGLDATNSHAYDRYVVLHSHECVPVSEVSPQEICQSDGCPTVAPAFLNKLATKLDHSALPVLLWIY